MWDWLSFAIITQAIEDYKECMENGRPTDEIEEFFLSEWCDVLLKNMTLTGTDILRFLKCG